MVAGEVTNGVVESVCGIDALPKAILVAEEEGQCCAAENGCLQELTLQFQGMVTEDPQITNVPASSNFVNIDQAFLVASDEFFRPALKLYQQTTVHLKCPDPAMVRPPELPPQAASVSVHNALYFCVSRRATWAVAAALTRFSTAPRFQSSRCAPLLPASGCA